MGILKNRGYVLNQYTKPDNIDEWYTSYEEVEYIFEHLTEDFTNKIIYCPFDGEESNFVKYIKENKNKLGYKELWYTNDDWYDHLDLFEKADFIISNPPFSELICHNKIKDEGILFKLKTINTKYFLLGGNISIYRYKNILEDNIHFIRRTKGFSFKLCNGNDYLNSSVCYITNMNNDFPKKKLELTKSYDELDEHFMAETKNDKCLLINRIKDIPYDYYDDMFVPITILFYENDRIILDNGIVGRILNRNCYMRCKIKLKKS